MERYTYSELKPGEFEEFHFEPVNSGPLDDVPANQKCQEEKKELPNPQAIASASPHQRRRVRQPRTRKVSLRDDEPCTCYKNGIPMSEHPILVTSADFVSCYKGRSYTLLEDETVLISDMESVATALI